MSHRMKLGATLVTMLLVVASCAATNRLYVNSEADQGYYKKVAVLPFANVSGNALAGPKVTRAFVTELSIADVYQIVEPEIVQDAMRGAGVDMDVQGRYPAERVKEIATKLGAQGVLQGTVSEFQSQRRGDEEVPVLAFDAQLTDLATGNIVWRVGVVDHGRGRVPLFGGGVRTLAQLAQKACQSAVADLRARALH